MSVVHKGVAAGLMAITLATTVPAGSAQAHSHDYFWGGVAAGAIGGVLLGSAMRPYPYTYGYPDGYGYPYAYGYRYGYPAYRAYAPYRPYYRAYRPYPAYRPAYYHARHCRLEWRRNGWGEAYRVRVCPY
jgi:hypothetical protein